jgi:tetratricopeptide (TPR) repeat protein
MRFWRLPASWILAGVAALLVPAACLLADTIVLKNGRRITATHVQEADGRVTYDTPAGQLSLPENIVARVIHDADPPDAQARPVNERAANLPLAPPESLTTATSNEVTRAAVHDGAVDRDYLDRVEGDAQGGSPGAIARAIVAESAAAEFEIGQGKLDLALQYYKRALDFAPENLHLLLNSAYLHLRRSEYREALDELDLARQGSPDSPDVAKLTGWAYYGLNRLDDAVSEWKRSLQLRPDAEVQHALEKAERDAQEEAGYRENETAHFELKFNGDATPALAREVLNTLEDHFTEIKNDLDYTPPEPIAVVLYTSEQFSDITRAPSWAGALNDGRIRVPVDGLSGMTDALSHVLKHELTHSFITQKTRGRCPVWLQEGAAQYEEGRRSAGAAKALLYEYDQHMDLSLRSYEGSWLNLTPDAAAEAYEWSLAAVETMVDAGGLRQISAMLDEIAADSTTENALRDVFGMNYEQLAAATAEYLRRTYP